MPEREKPVDVLILAAGASQRMRGRDKLLERIDGIPQLRRVADAACLAETRVGVTLPAGDRERAAVLQGLGLEIIDVTDAQAGMSASLRAWAAGRRLTGASNPDGLLIMLGDMPDVTSADIRLLISEFRIAGGDRIIRATDADHNPGHPVVLPRRLFERLATLSGDQGARALLQGEDILPVVLPGHHATCDLDTPEDWQAWRKARGG